MTQWPEPLVVAAIGAVLVQLVSLLLNWVTASRVASVAKQQEILIPIAKDTEAIKGHVNSEKTAAEGREAMKDKEITLLREQLADEKVTKQLLAQAAALVPALAVVPGLPPPPAADAPVLDKIESHTKATADNTARMEAVVTDLKAKT